VFVQWSIISRNFKLPEANLGVDGRTKSKCTFGEMVKVRIIAFGVVMTSTL